ncbi:hypothetical protein [Luteirhabdus pelagi]|uniref:hypothetical protein n=1 Tax=Luteirhabdus pelagi TaxID=2792783 RepID=UPI00193A5175|nr:hypothetical protein [Luteirhabdus pelagi]
MIQELQKICEENDCSLKQTDLKELGPGSSRTHISKYNLQIFQNGTVIDSIFDFGKTDSAKFIIELEPLNRISEFELTSFEHLRKLILFRKQNWELKPEHGSLRFDVEKLLAKHGLINLMEKTAFQPEMSGKLRNRKYRIETMFSLKYDGNIQSIKPIVDFHKELVDLIKLKYCS